MLRCCRCRHHQNLHKKKRIVMDIEEIDVKSLIVDGLGRVDMSQKFCNRVKSNIECEYVIIVPEDAVLTEMFVVFDSGETVNAQIQETETAKEIYNDAISSGDTSIMSSYQKSNKLVFYIGNFLSKASLIISISYTIPLSTKDLSWYLEYPLILYAFKSFTSQKTTILVKFVSTIKSSYRIYTTQNLCNFNAECVFSNDCHEVNISCNKNFNVENQLNFFISYKVEALVLSSCLVQELSGSFAAMVSFVPFTGLENIESQQGTGEFILLFDRSGSMSGKKISLAIQACIVFLKSLPIGSKFNIVSFGDNYNNMFNTSSDVNEENIEIAVKKTKKFKADMGGTNIKSPLMFIFDKKTDFRYPRSIFLLTDGQVNDTNDVVDIISENSLDSRVHSIGIGSDVDKDLIIFSAKAGRGSASFVEKVEEIGKTVVSALKKAILPCLNNWQVSLSGEQTPENNDLGNVFYGDRLITYFLLTEKPNVLPTIQAYNNLTGQVQNFTVPIINFIDGDNIFPLWAKKKIEKLCLNPEPDIKEIVKISKEFKALSPYTSFICVKENEEPVFEEPLVAEIQNQNQKLLRFKTRARTRGSARGRGCGSGRGSGRGRGGLIFLKKKSFHCMPLSSHRSRSRSFSEEDDEDDEDDEDEDFEDRGIEEIQDTNCRDRYRSAESKCKKSIKRKKMSKPDNSSSNSSNLYLSILSNQSIDGKWECEKLQKIIPTIVQYQKKINNIPNNPDCFTTLFAICYLQTFYTQYLDELELIFKKAQKWLELNWSAYKQFESQLFELLKSSN
ncbi:hypothetical protein SteCoe_35071 [Stentor coeruleus]|uniref:VWFA domain-containing protein n=1 Tax=Stentor coeruleus TaxID=5963 RepID=A0A1R2AT51_9CILI|nr:hypothetical protein SteCoe_35071 [Stentor coeruleus]